MKISVNFDDELLNRIDDYAKSYKLNRACVIRSFCVKALNENDLISGLKNISLSIRKIAENNSIDDEAKKTLENFEFLVSQIYKI